MPTYAFRDAHGDVVSMNPELGKPIPVHAQTEGAADAVEAVRRYGHERRASRLAASIVAVHGTPVRRRWAGKPPADLVKVEELATVAGFETIRVPLLEGHRIEGHHPGRRVGFRATWIRGRTTGCSWHEPYRYALVRDERAIKMNDRDRVGLKGYRTEGMGTTRLTMLACPGGMPLNVTTLLERLGRMHA